MMVLSTDSESFTFASR